MKEIINATVKSTMLGMEDHGIFTAFLMCEWPGSGCGFGGYALDAWSAEDKKRIGTRYGMEFISECIRVIGVEKWEDIKGKHIRVECEGWGGGITRIGHIIEDKWFDPKALAEKLGGAA